MESKPKPPGNAQVKAITAYQTTDGKKFETREEASKHQDHLDRADALLSIVEGFYFYNMSQADIAKGILDNREALKKVL